MPDDMNLSINGQSQVPPGFRFHPTEEELLHYYLRKKVAFEKIDLDVIREVDLNKLEPWDIQEKCKIGSTPQNDWYFFSHKDKKYPTGTRTNRATAAGFWKATGRDKIIYSGSRRIGLRKTLVFYKGRAPHGQKSDWIMHEYRLDDTSQETIFASNPIGESIQEEGWVVCRVFRKKNFQKSLESPKGSSSSLDSKNNQNILGSGNDGVLDQILLYMGRTLKTENESVTQMNLNTNTTASTFRFLSSASNNESAGIINERFLHLPRLDSPTLSCVQFDHHHQDTRNLKSCYQCYDKILENDNNNHQLNSNNNNSESLEMENCSIVQENNKPAGLNDWATYDRLVASQLNGQSMETETSNQLSCFNDPTGSFGLTHDDENDEIHHQLSQIDHHMHQSNKSSNGLQPQLYSNENDLWSSFTKSSTSPSSSDPLCHLSV